METEDPFASLGGLGSGLGANFGPRNAPFRSQSFNVGSNSAPKKDKMQDPPVEHDLYVSLDDIYKVRQVFLITPPLLDKHKHINIAGLRFLLKDLLFLSIKFMEITSV